MKKLLNSLYVMKQGSYLHKERETVVIENERQKIAQYPIHSIGAIHCFGNVLVSPYIYGLCADYGIILSFYNEYGRFLGRMQTKQTGNIMLRRLQYRLADENPVNIARNIVAAKISSSRKVLQRHNRNQKPSDMDENLTHSISVLQRYITKLQDETDIAVIRGIEGEAASRYFGHFNRMVLNESFSFSGRNRRPPRDPVNAMLSFMYSIAAGDISAALQGVGLDAQAGFLHADRSGRDSLALDLLEEFRAWLIDRLVLSMVNKKQVAASGFKHELSGAVSMSDDVRKLLLAGYQQRKQDTIRHPYLDEDVPIGLLYHVQAKLLAAHIRGELDKYPPFILR